MKLQRSIFDRLQTVINAYIPYFISYFLIVWGIIVFKVQWSLLPVPLPSAWHDPAVIVYFFAAAMLYWLSVAQYKRRKSEVTWNTVRWIRMLVEGFIVALLVNYLIVETTLISWTQPKLWPVANQSFCALGGGVVWVCFRYVLDRTE